MKNFIPLFDRVLVQRLAAEANTKDGVLIPEKSQGKVLEATVVAVGPGRRTDVSLVLCVYVVVFNAIAIATSVEIGDMVFYGTIHF